MSADPKEDSRWPAEVEPLLQRYPRDTWPTQSSAEARFWLEIHDHFRHACVGLETMATEYAEGRCSADALAVMAGPRLHGLVASLHGHHQIEDRHYFPAFRHADRRVGPALALLERDHVNLQVQIDLARRALGELRATASTPSTPAGTTTLAAHQYVAAVRGLCRQLCSHLSDEEDLVVPVLIELGGQGNSRHIDDP